MKVTFVTGNAGKAKYFSELIGREVDHQAVETEEIQSLELGKIAEHKARQAYAKLQSPVIVEDTALVINSLGQLPGPFIKWFEESMGFEKVCRLADISPDRSAVASSVYAYYDGQSLELFPGDLAGTIADHPRGQDGFGWNPIFIPHYADKTLAEMEDAEFKKAYVQIKSIYKLRDFLDSLDKK